MSKNNEEVTSKSYTLRNEDGSWLGQIVLTSDGMFSSVTDWGNFSFAWRSFGPDDFRDFIIGLNNSYFGDKMAIGIGYIAHSKKIDAACYRFADKILPVLQDVLRKEIEEEKVKSNTK